MASLLMIYCILLTSIPFFLLSPPTRPPKAALALSLFSPLINDSFLKPFLSMRPPSSLTFSLIILLFVFLFFLSFFPPRPSFLASFPSLFPFPLSPLSPPFSCSYLLPPPSSLLIILFVSFPFLPFFSLGPSFLSFLPFSLFPSLLLLLPPTSSLLPPDYFVVCLFSFPSF